MNTYTYVWSEEHSKLLKVGNTLMVHGADNCCYAERFAEIGMKPADIWSRFCGRCGNLIVSNKCCGNTERQIYYPPD